MWRVKITLISFKLCIKTNYPTEAPLILPLSKLAAIKSMIYLTHSYVLLQVTGDRFEAERKIELLGSYDQQILAKQLMDDLTKEYNDRKGTYIDKLGSSYLNQYS